MLGRALLEGCGDIPHRGPQGSPSPFCGDRAGDRAPSPPLLGERGWESSVDLSLPISRSKNLRFFSLTYFWLGFTEAQGGRVMCLPTRGLSRDPRLELRGCSSPSPPGCRDLGPEPAPHGGLHPVAPKRSAPRPNDSWAALTSKFDIYKLFWQAFFFASSQLPAAAADRSGPLGVGLGGSPGDAAAEGTLPAVPGARWPCGCSGEVGTWGAQGCSGGARGVKSEKGDCFVKQIWGTIGIRAQL